MRRGVKLKLPKKSEAIIQRDFKGNNVHLKEVTRYKNFIEACNMHYCIFSRVSMMNLYKL